MLSAAAIVRLGWAGVNVASARPAIWATLCVDSDHGQRPRVLGISDVRFLRVFTP